MSQLRVRGPWFLWQRACDVITAGGTATSSCFVLFSNWIILSGMLCCVLFFFKQGGFLPVVLPMKLCCFALVEKADPDF